MIAFKLLLWLLPIAFNVWTDRNGRKPDYLIVFILRGFVIILYLGGVWDMQGGYSLIEDFKENWSLWLFCLTSYWLFFEIGLNVVRGRIKQLGFWSGLLYYDTVEKDSGWIDGFFAKYPKLHAPVKVLTFLLMLMAITDIYGTR